MTQGKIVGVGRSISDTYACLVDFYILVCLFSDRLFTNNNYFHKLCILQVKSLYAKFYYLRIVILNRIYIVGKYKAYTFVFNFQMVLNHFYRVFTHFAQDNLEVFNLELFRFFSAYTFVFNFYMVLNHFYRVLQISLRTAQGCLEAFRFLCHMCR